MYISYSIHAATRNDLPDHQPRAAHSPLQSVPMFRPVAQQRPRRILAAQALQQVQDEIGETLEAYGQAKTAVGECNRKG